MTSEEFENGARLHGLWLARDPAGKRLELRDVSLVGVSLNGGARLLRAKLRAVDFSRAELAGASFRGSELEDVRFDGANLTKADFAECGLFRCRFDGAELGDASFANGRVVQSSFFAARMAHANLAKSTFETTAFVEAVLTRAHLVRFQAKHCDLRGCDLSGSELAAATLSDTDLRRADLSEAHLYATRFERTKVCGLHGTPFLAEHFGAGLDFSPEGDGSDSGSLERLRTQLGGGPGPGSGRYGIGATPSLYRAYEVTQEGEPYYVISRESDAEEVLRIRRVALENDECLIVEFEQLDPRFENWLAADLIYDVLLRAFLNDSYRGKAAAVDYRNVTTGYSNLNEYGVHQPPARG